ncbi:UNVERIFIED_CONTAM: Nudix hydrolase 8 [Sesamum radiatum]|uniref:Nudix hydrolase 8 n=1 Tax=Sesamum radiatum TaxID=300843 RepID=A0AAW2LA65_SESRA
MTTSEMVTRQLPVSFRQSSWHGTAAARFCTSLSLKQPFTKMPSFNGTSHPARFLGDSTKGVQVLSQDMGKKGIWLKLLEEQAELAPIAIQEGFAYHHAEPGYVMLTYWIPGEPCLLPPGPSHQIGVAGFVINDNKEVLVTGIPCHIAKEQITLICYLK